MPDLVPDMGASEGAALFERLFAHMEWADARVVEGLAHQEHAEALELFGHVLGAEEIWLARLEGRPSELAVWPQLSAAQCTREAARIAAAFRVFRAGLAGEAWRRDCRYTTSDGREFTTPVDEILLHVALHGTYHRGQIATLLRQAGGAPVPSDYIAFARGAPAATRPDAPA